VWRERRQEKAKEVACDKTDRVCGGADANQEKEFDFPDHEGKHSTSTVWKHAKEGEYDKEIKCTTKARIGATKISTHRTSIKT
jgi:hypothetical protein